MAVFPMFIELAGKQVLIVGGGSVAARKAEKLLPFGPEIRVIAPEISEEIRRMPVAAETRPFRESDIPGNALVIAATDDPGLNARISSISQTARIPVNSVDDKENCTFIFPALVQRGRLTVGISTDGASPTAAQWLREQVEDMVPSDMEAILDYLAGLRCRYPAGRNRQRMLAAAARTCLEADRILTREEEEKLWADMCI